MSDYRYVDQDDMDRVYLVQTIDNNGYASYYGPYFDKNVAKRMISAWKSKRSNSAVAMHILESDVDWKESDG